MQPEIVSLGTTLLNPTFLELCGAKAPMDGRVHVRSLTGEVMVLGCMAGQASEGGVMLLTMFCWKTLCPYILHIIPT